MRSFVSKKREWACKIDQWSQSGKSAKAWCRENKVVYTTFIGWRDRLKDSRSQNPLLSQIHHSVDSLTSKKIPYFIELKEKPNTYPAISLECAGVQIHLSGDFDAALLRKCLNVLRGDPC